MKKNRHLLIRILYLSFVPFICLCNYVAGWGNKIFEENQRFKFKHVIVLLVFIVMSPLFILTKPIQKAYIHILNDEIDELTLEKNLKESSSFKTIRK